jgi:methionine-rich copper-binding protein CopC
MHTMKTLKTLLAATVLSSAVIAAPFASAHAKLTFNEKIEQSFSSMSVIDSDGKAVSDEKAKVDTANPAVLRLPLTRMHPGAYTVKWAVAGHDGHRRTGDLTFTVK